MQKKRKGLDVWMYRGMETTKGNKKNNESRYQILDGKHLKITVTNIIKEICECRNF